MKYCNQHRFSYSRFFAKTHVLGHIKNLTKSPVITVVRSGSVSTNGLFGFLDLEEKAPGDGEKYGAVITAFTLTALIGRSRLR